MNQIITTDLPYEKFLRVGPQSLTDAELLAIILRTGTRDENAVQIGQNILNLTGNNMGLLGLHHITVNELKQIKGIGEVKATKIKCVAELSSRIARTKAIKGICFQTPQTVAEYYMESLRHLEKEVCYVVFLDGKNHLIEEVCISVGSVNASIVPIREIFRQALRCNAVYFLLLHNHPSGDATPSKDDIIVTERLTQTAALMEIFLVDHIIIGDNTYTSFKEKCLL